MASDMIFATRMAPGQDRANPVPDQKLRQSQNVLRGARYIGCSILMLCETACLCSDVVVLARRQQDLAEKSVQFVKSVQWQDFGDILVRADNNQTAFISVYFA